MGRIVAPMKSIRLCLPLLFVTATLGAQAPAQDHPGTFDRADIETGSRLYTGQCAAWHGPNGDMVNGIDLRRAQFRGPLSDEDLTRVIKAGRPSAGMPAFATLQPVEITGLIAFIRTNFDAAA